MPNPTNEFSKQAPAFWDQRDGPRTEPVYNKADENASKQLGRLAVFIVKEFPGKVSDGFVVDIAIDLLTEFKNLNLAQKLVH